VVPAVMLLCGVELDPGGRELKKIQKYNKKQVIPN